MTWTYWNNTDVREPWEFESATELMDAVESHIPYSDLRDAKATSNNIFSEYIRAPDNSERVRVGAKTLRKVE